MEFEAKLILSEGFKDATYIEIPFNVKEVFGSGGIVKVKGTVDGIPFRSALSPMLKTCHIMVVTQAQRASTGKKAGDIVKVSIEKDTGERFFEIPYIFTEALKLNGILDAYNSLSYTIRKELAESITTAKREQTKIKRLNKAINFVKSKTNL